MSDKEFWRWFHRQEKGRVGGKTGDLDSVEEVRVLYEEWLRIGRPKAK